jgi:nucleotide-binding universal stress UspA family protein
MQGVICAIRGGPASGSTIRHAIELAKRKQLPLTFLYVVNLDFLSRTMTSRTASIEEDLHEMGEMVLLMALEIAAAQDVVAQQIVRQGDVVGQIMALCRELDANYVVVGEPLFARKTAIFNREKVASLGNTLKKYCQAELIVVP